MRIFCVEETRPAICCCRRHFQNYRGSCQMLNWQTVKELLSSSLSSLYPPRRRASWDRLPLQDNKLAYALRSSRFAVVRLGPAAVRISVRPPPARSRPAGARPCLAPAPPPPSPAALCMDPAWHLDACAIAWHGGRVWPLGHLGDWPVKFAGRESNKRMPCKSTAGATASPTTK